jgi:hypothetical protein
MSLYKTVLPFFGVSTLCFAGFYTNKLITTPDVPILNNKKNSEKDDLPFL